MKSYTNIEQSKKLAEILPIESADMYWLNRHIDLTETKYEVFVIDKSNKYIDFFKSYAVAVDNNEIIQCWSLAALLAVLQKTAYFIDEDANVVLDSYKTVEWDLGINNSDLELVTESNPVDACYEMILKLNEQKLL